MHCCERRAHSWSCIHLRLEPVFSDMVPYDKTSTELTIHQEVQSVLMVFQPLPAQPGLLQRLCIGRDLVKTVADSSIGTCRVAAKCTVWLARPSASQSVTV